MTHVANRNHCVPRILVLTLSTGFSLMFAFHFRFSALLPRRPPTVTAKDLRTLRLPWSVLLANKAHELWTKTTGRRIKGQGMIAADPDTVRRGFDALRAGDFDTYNLPQVWVERRQIPRAINGRIPLKNAVILDLGCGPGTSTEVLCHFADPSWSITGFDITSHLIDHARTREFRNRAGESIRPRFERQDIAEPLRISNAPVPRQQRRLRPLLRRRRRPLPERSPGPRLLAAELARTVKPGAFAAIDAGPAVPAVPAPRLIAIMSAAGFAHVRPPKKLFIEPRPKLVFVCTPHVHLPQR